MKRAKGRQAGAGISKNSGDPADKLAACLNHSIRGHADKLMAGYFAACGRWYAGLTPDQRDTVAVVIDCIAGPHGDAAEGIAATLPAAPKFPLQD